MHQNAPTISTEALISEAPDGSVFVGYDGLNFAYWGHTVQGNGDVVVHLEYADESGERHDIEVAKADLNEAYWDL